MINFKCKSELEKYSSKHLHLMLGIIFNDNINLSYINKDNSKYIKFILDDGLESCIKTNFLEMSENLLILAREKNCKKDSLERALITKEDAEKISVPHLDIEIDKLREEICNFLKENNFNYSISNFLNKPTVCLTHDVDSIKSNSIIRFFSKIMRSVMKLNIIDLAVFLKSTSIFKNTHGDFKEFMEIEKNYNFKSTFYFLSLPFFLGREGRRYSVNSKKIKKYINQLIDNGFEVGLHMSRKGYQIKKIGTVEISRLGQTANKNFISGVRNHYLTGYFPKVWNDYEKLFDYDSSLGSSEHLVYRAGTSFPFYPFDVSKNRALDIIEVPFAIMDGVLTGSSEEIFTSVKKHIDFASKHKSLINIIWHTDRILPGDFTEHSLAYKKILEYLHDGGFDSLTMSELVEKYKTHVTLMDSNISFI